MSKDSIGKILLVAVSLCVVCSVVVSALAVGLRDKQEANKKLDKKRNVLIAAGVIDADEKADVAELFKSIETVYVDLATGEEAKLTDEEKAEFDQRKRAKEADTGIDIDPELDTGDIKRRSKIAEAFIRRENGKIVTLVLPFHGKGLWSTMYGFMALEPDLKTVKGLVFYEHGETPGLGGEVENPNWLAQWPGKEMYNDEGNYAFEVLKGAVVDGDPKEKYKADGLSGATITIRGVDGMLKYWLGDTAFKPFLDKLAAKEGIDG